MGSESLGGSESLVGSESLGGKDFKALEDSKAFPNIGVPPSLFFPPVHDWGSDSHGHDQGSPIPHHSFFFVSFPAFRELSGLRKLSGLRELSGNSLATNWNSLDSGNFSETFRKLFGNFSEKGGERSSIRA